MRERARGLLLLLALAAAPGCERAVGPAPVAWDRTRCQRCGMLVSDPGYAAQLRRSDGSVEVFDDPGCLLLTLGAGAGEGSPALWFHHAREERWLAGDAVAFVAAPHTPMGYGLAAVGAAEAPDGLGLAAARGRVDQLERRRLAPAGGRRP